MTGKLWAYSQNSTEWNIIPCKTTKPASLQVEILYLKKNHNGCEIKVLFLLLCTSLQFLALFYSTCI